MNESTAFGPWTDFGEFPKENEMTEIEEWVYHLNLVVNRKGWLPFDNVGATRYDGVQAWSENGDETDAVGVIGMLCPPQDDYDEYGNPNPDGVRWTVINGEEPNPRFFPTAEDAMRFAEDLREDLFLNEED